MTVATILELNDLKVTLGALLCFYDNWFCYLDYFKVELIAHPPPSPQRRHMSQSNLQWIVECAGKVMKNYKVH